MIRQHNSQRKCARDVRESLRGNREEREWRRKDGKVLIYGRGRLIRLEESWKGKKDNMGGEMGENEARKELRDLADEEGVWG
jgi:hypothetical protein